MTSTMRFDRWQNSLGQTYGTVLQVVTVSKSDAFASTVGAVWGDIPGLSVTIPPRFANSRFLVMADIKAAGTVDATTVRAKVVRGISGTFTDVGVGDAAGSRPRSLGQFYINNAGGGLYYMAQVGGNISDLPNTLLPVTYKAQIGADTTGTIVRVNITQGDRDNPHVDARGHSSITVMEIAQ